MTQLTEPTQTMRNGQVFERIRRQIAGGGSSNMRNAGMTDPLVVERSAGCRLWDVEGNELIDVNMGYGPHLFGYAHPDVLGVVADRLRLGAITGLPHRLDYEAGELVTSLVPGVEQLRFANSGTEAIASALRLARFATGRNLVVTFEGHYHGWSETILREATITSGQAGLPTAARAGAPGMIPESLTHTLQLRFNDLEALEKTFVEYGDEIAAVILEPLCANAGVVAPQPGFLARIRELTTEYGVLLVFDEVITGFRLSQGGAQELYGVRPDLTILSKVLGGGFPVALFGGSAAVMAPLARNEAFHAGVYAGNHAAVAAVVATLTKIAADPGIYQRLELESAILEDRLRTACADRPVRLTRVGSVLSLALLTETGDDPFDSGIRRIDFGAHRGMQVACQRDGVYFHPNPLEPWFISTAHTTADLSRVADVVANAVRQV
jgi:glutamate-1-semialdehyde 2,1-aminomutase